MTPRARFHLAAVTSSLVAALGAPALGRTASGGASPFAGQGSTPVAQPGGGEVSSSAGGMTITTRQSAFLAGDLQFTGSVPASYAGDTIEVERYGHETAWSWAPTATGTVASDGSFQTDWHVDHIGRFAFRAVLTRPGGAAASAGWPTVTVTVYRPSLATEYGPGFYGHRTACGVVLRRTTIGLANRRLPCGARVAVYYRGSTIVVPVIDRGPYANGADWDLTMATGRALGMTGTARIGAVSLPGRR